MVSVRKGGFLKLFLLLLANNMLGFSFIPSQIALKTGNKKSIYSQRDDNDLNNPNLVSNGKKSNGVNHVNRKCLQRPKNPVNVTVKSNEIDKSGDFANVHWRAIPLSDLRDHPLYIELPVTPPLDTKSILNSAQYFRQESWQWDALHKGRLTSSRLSSILGFYEQDAAEKLGIPRSLRSHSRAVSKFLDLCAKPHEDWSFLFNDIGLKERISNSKQKPRISWKKNDKNDKNKNNSMQFPYIYKPQKLPRLSKDMGYKDAGRARMAWGSIQEATAVLAALNYFHQQDEDTKVRESGMCILETHEATVDIKNGKFKSDETIAVYKHVFQAIKQHSLPLIGASPDGIVEHSNGDIEVLEIKCSSPFIRNTNSKKCEDDSLKMKNLRIAPPFSSNLGNIGSWHIPQLQLEMFCAGPTCKSAVVVLLSIYGYQVYRVQRDDEYIMMMFSFAQKFFEKFISKVKSNLRKPPQPKFMYNESVQIKGKSISYDSFLDATKKLALSSSLVYKDYRVQRSPYNNYFFLDEQI